MKRWFALVVVCLLAVISVKQNKSAPMPRQALPVATQQVLEAGPYRMVRQRPSADAEDQHDRWYIVETQERNE